MGAVSPQTPPPHWEIAWVKWHTTTHPWDKGMDEMTEHLGEGFEPFAVTDAAGVIIYHFRRYVV